MKKNKFFLIFIAIVFLLLIVSMVFSYYYVHYRHKEKIHVMKLFSDIELNLFKSNSAINDFNPDSLDKNESLVNSLEKLSTSFEKLKSSLKYSASIGANDKNSSLIKQLELASEELEEYLELSWLIVSNNLNSEEIIILQAANIEKLNTFLSISNLLNQTYLDIINVDQEKLELIQELRIAITVVLFTTLFIWLFIYIKNVGTAQQRIKDSESKYRNIFLNSPLGIFHFDSDGIITDFNEKFIEILNSSREKLTGINLLQLPDKKLAEQVRLTLLNGYGYYEDLYTSITSGKKVNAKIYLRGIRDLDNRIISGMGVVEDISELKKVENNLRESLEKNSAIVSALPDLLFQLDSDGTFTEYYANTDEALYLDPAIFIGKKVSDIFPKELSDLTMEKIYAAKVTGEMQLYEYPLEMNDEIRYYESRIVKSGENSLLAIIRDITENKRIAEMLQASRERYEAFIDETHEGIYRIEFTMPISTNLPSEEQAKLFYKNGYIAECNSAFVKMYGAKYPYELIGKQISEFHDLERYPENFNKTVDLINRGYRVENQHTTESDKKGNTLHFSNNAFGIVEDGFLLRIWGTQKDITALIEAEEEKKILYRAVEQSPVSIVITDLNGNIEYVNPKFEDVTGYSYDQAIGKNPNILKSGRTTDEQYKELWEKISGGETWTGIFQNKKKNGELFFESASISPITDEDGSVRHYIAVKEDITELTKAQIELKNYKEYLEQVVERRTEELNNKNIFLRTLIDTIPNPVFVKNRAGKYTDVNKAFIELFELGFDEIIGETVKKIANTQIASEAEEADNKLLKEHGKIIYESVAQNKSGRTIPIMVYKASFGPEEEVPEGIVGLIIDITKSKETQHQMQKALEQERELNEMKSNFISLASHELRTPLTAIYSSTELIEKFGRKWTEDKFHSHIARIKYSVENLTDLMEDLLTLSRVETGKIEFSPSRLKLKKLVEENLISLEPLKKATHNFKVEFNLKSEEYFLDEKLIKYIIQNLISNALKYSPDGGDVELFISDYDDNINIKIKDHGIGIEQEELNNLFEPFYRGRNVSNISGTGLGLSIVKEAVELHNGTINVNSEIKKWTQFEIILPLIQ